PATPTAPAPKPAALKVGDKVKINASAGKYSRSTVTIPATYKGKAYTVAQLGTDDVRIKELNSWVKRKDLTRV
ncbi:MAG: hypothetical protein LBN05_09110, partial [Oscillospiraceae bacterium]|nr:hypothetical protein [Oscillospiraceae bacterium]